MAKQNNNTEDSQVKIGMEFRGMYVSEFWVKISEEFVKLDSETPGGFRNYTYEVTCVNSAIMQESLVNIQVLVSVFLDTEKKIQLGFLSLSNVFFIHELIRFADDSTKTYKLPADFEAVIISISLSHSRAILISKCAGTFLQNALLPILDPNAFIRRG
jgi:hypothetical protein